MNEKISYLNNSLLGKNPYEILSYISGEFKGKIAFGSSLGLEDQVITDMLTRIDNSVKIFTLDTGRLFPESYDLIERTNKHYGISIDVCFPNYAEVESMVKEKGINLFYSSIENRKLCCNIRKIRPSQRALKGMEVWITGIRKDQSVSRFFNNLIEFDDGYQLIKVNPLLNWTEKQVWEYIKKENVPYNVLHDKGFPSIGCQPCTRAIKPGEEIRAGRWWWEEPEHKECGLHNRPKKN